MQKQQYENERPGKRKQWKEVRVELRAGGDLYGPEKPG